MNTESPESPDFSQSPGPDVTDTPPRSTREKLDDLSRDLTETIRRGGRDARRTFEEGFPKVKSDFAKGLHEVAYAVGYASTFAAAILREATPESVQKGFREGAESGRRAADRVVRERRERNERNERSEENSDEAGPESIWV